MSSIQGPHSTLPLSQAQGTSAGGRVDPRLAGVVRHAVLATPRLATDLSQVARFPEKPIEARKASVVAENAAPRG